MDVCAHAEVLKVIYFVMMLIDIVKIIIPIALIVLGLVEFSKAAISSDEKVQKKSGQLFLKRLLYGILIFAIPWIIEVLMVTLGNLLEDDDTINFTDCLENTKDRECIDALESKNIDTIKSKCDVPEDFTIEDDSSNSGNDNDPDNGGATDVNAVCWQCNDNPNVLQWGKSYTSNSNCHAGWHQVNYTKERCNSSGGSFITSDKNITFSYDWEDKAVMPYILYTPSTAKNNTSTPLIIWLHGSGEINDTEDDFKGSGLPAVLNDWKLDGFNAYVLCPRSPVYGWKNQKDQFYTLIDNIIKEKNINTDKIILVGHSMGGLGVEEIADGKTDYYSALVILSGYRSGVDRNQFKNMPVRGYVGGPEENGIEYELKDSYAYMTGTFKKTYGEENLYILKKKGHGEVPRIAFNLDSNKDNKSDLIEWMLSQ